MNDNTYIEPYAAGDYTIYEDLSISTEAEMGDLLYGMVRQIKPELVFEDGAGVGHGTLALARACAANGKGRVIACENNESYWKQAVERVKGLPAEVDLQSTPCHPAVEEADFIFADGDYPNRKQCFHRAKAGCIIVVHDTAIEKDLEDFVMTHGGQCFNFGRGFGILRK